MGRTVNIARGAALQTEGRMTAAGLAAFERRRENKVGIDSFERRRIERSASGAGLPWLVTYR